MKKVVFISIIAMLLIFSVIYFIAFQPLLTILNGYTAKRICSSHFIAGRVLEDIENQDLVYPATWCSGEIDMEQMSASSSVLGLATQSAIFRPGFGCTLSPKNNTLKPTPILSRNKVNPYQWSDNGFKQKNKSKINPQKLGETISAAFGTIDRTRAVIVAHNGKIVGEQYADGFNKETELLGWSMTKSITNNLIGILCKEGKLDVNKTNLLKEWSDQRSQISLENLLHMSSGIEWNEEYGYLSDVTRMLYLNDNASDYAIDKSVGSEINTSYTYSSGTTNIISKIIKNTFNSEDEYLKFPHEALFQKLGIEATMELDADNNYIMSSYTYMTARDWAKLGQFWLQKGSWLGEQILPKDWMAYSTSSGYGVNGIYGAHFWLNSDSFLYTDVPDDMFAARGFQGQQIIVIPSQDLVIVRFGVDSGIETFDYNIFISSIIASIEDT